MDQSSTIRFILDGNIIEIPGCNPTRSVLEYLREDLHRCGTKEGCAEGDCGACTVVIGEISAQGLKLRSVNACLLLLPMIHGKLLITVESLAAGQSGLHPVQQAMVDSHGSQCGFCTPGFVMSLFALYKNEATPADAQIGDALSGNLCRCTGYRPILAAAQQMYDLPAGDGPDWLYRDGEETVLLELLERIRPAQMLAIESDANKFYAPVNAQQLSRLLRDYPDATLVAGNTDVGLWINKQLRQLPVIIYLGLIDGLDGLIVSETDLHIGAMVSLSDAFTELSTHFPSLTDLFRRFASQPIRNAGTLGGNVANGSPIGDSMPALLALDARVQLNGPDGQRILALQDFYLGYQQKDLRQGEWLEAVIVPLPDDSSGYHLRSYKVSKRYDQDISAVCAAFSLQLDDAGVVSEIRIAFGGMSATPARSASTEAALVGQAWDQVSIGRACQALTVDFTPLDDLRASARYRMRVAQNLLQRFYLETTPPAQDIPLRIEQLEEVVA